MTSHELGTKWTRERRSKDTLTLPNFDAFFTKWTNINASDYSLENYFQELLAALTMAVSSKHFVESHMYYTHLVPTFTKLYHP